MYYLYLILYRNHVISMFSNNLRLRALGKSQVKVSTCTWCYDVVFKVESKYRNDAI